jgi:hypothetical protein
MKKASIITLQYIDNYGSVLQAFATQRIIEKFGYNAEIVDYVRENCTYKYQKKEAYQRYRSRNDIFSLPIIAKLLVCRWSRKILARNKAFSLFRSKYLKMSHPYTNFAELMQDPPAADIYVTGSDQVWNPEYNNGVLPEYFLEFAPNNSNRIALSASIGVDTLAEDNRQEMSKYIQKYKGISVRESGAAELIKSMGYKNVVNVLDPTLMLDKDEWSKSFDLSSTSKKYVLLYQLNENADMVQFATQIANDKGIELYIISSTCRKAECKYHVFKNCPPDKYLDLIYNADSIITDSFHGTAFSLNFNKQVYIFNPPKYSDRLSSILRLTNTEYRNVKGNVKWDEIPGIDYEEVNMRLYEEREKVNNYLKQYLV